LPMAGLSVNECSPFQYTLTAFGTLAIILPPFSQNSAARWVRFAILAFLRPTPHRNLPWPTFGRLSFTVGMSTMVNIVTEDFTVRGEALHRGGHFLKAGHTRFGSFLYPMKARRT